MNYLSVRARGRYQKVIGPLAAVFIALVFFMMPSDTAKGCADGIQLCLNVAVPSLFPMMFAAVLATETGVTQWLGRVLAPVMRRMFSLSDEAGGAVLMALIGGFPAGAKTVSGLYERGAVSREEAGRMSLFCFAAGPAFLLGAVGGIYSGTAVGVVLVIIQILSVVMVGILSRMLCRGHKMECGNEYISNVQKKVGFSEAMTKSVSQTASAMLNICLYIILFSTIRAVLDQSGISESLASLLTGLGFSSSAAYAVLPIVLEVTSGCAAAAEAGLPATAFAVGFGGLAVHMQVLAVSRNIGIKYGLFLIARLIQGLLCALMMRLYLLIAPDIAVTASASLVSHAAVSSTPAGAVVLVVMSAMCLLCLPKTEWQ